jgi:hypothetical protein
MDVIEIVTSYLIANGYDGLVEEFGECACLVGDPAPCGQISDSCRAGHRVHVPRGSCEEHGDRCTWHIVAGRRPNPAPGEVPTS